jgi:hypothetical protein
MTTYSEFRPTGFDCRGRGLPDRQSWFVAPVGRNRDSGPLDESNFAVALKILGGKSETVEIHRFGHWGPGWFEIILVSPDSIAFTEAERIECSLSDYPVLDDMDFSERESDAANETWRNCYREKERIAYIRKHRSEFEFADLRDMLSCVRGNYFAGYASELIAH